MLKNGAFFIFLDLPEGTEFGIDYKSWNVGSGFRGLKSIPPGIHFLFYSSCNKSGQTGPRSGFFYEFKEDEVVVRKWDKYNENVKKDALSDEEMQRYRDSLVDIQRYLGPYPMDSYKKWVSLTSYLTGENMRRLQPISCEITSAPQFFSEASDSQTRLKIAAEKRFVGNSGQGSEIPSSASDIQVVSGVKTSGNRNVKEEGDLKDDASTSNDRDETVGSSQVNDVSGIVNDRNVCRPVDRNSVSKMTPDDKLPIMQQLPGTEIRFSPIPATKYPPGSSPREITMYSMDSSYVLSCILDNMRKSGVTNPEVSLLGEIQFAFICFLIGQVYDAFDQWKRLVAIMCTSEDAVSTYPGMFLDFISVIHYEIREVPRDFFVDIVTQSNFLTTTLHDFFVNVESVGSESLRTRARKFKQHLTEKFQWDFAEEPSDYAPVVVT